jgi:metalloendopeptidase OMA1, mitochondrial
VPASGRVRFNIVSPEWEQQIGDEEYQKLLQEFRGSILPDHHPEVRRVKRVLAKLVRGLEKLKRTDDFDENGQVVQSSPLGEWKVHVIQSDIANAFVIPGLVGCSD